MEPLVLPRAEEIVVARQSVMHVGRRDAAGGHLLGLEPDAHGEGAVAQDVGALDAADGAQLGLDDAGQVVGDLVLIEVGRKKIQGKLLQTGCRQFEGSITWNLRIRRKIVADLRDLGLDLRRAPRWCRS